MKLPKKLLAYYSSLVQTVYNFRLIKYMWYSIAS